MKRLVFLVFVLTSSLALAGSIFLPLKFGKRVPITVMEPVLDAKGSVQKKADGTVMTVPKASTKWDGDARWLTFSVDDKGAWTVNGAVCVAPDPTHPDAALVKTECRDVRVEAQVLTDSESRVLTARFKQLVLASKLKSGD